MQIDFLEQTITPVHGTPMLTPPSYDDPLDPDCVADVPVVTTQRALLRVALVAAETATRFARDGIETDPMAWMMASRRLFDGRSAIEGCLEREGCLRAILLHGLSIGLDADPEAIDALAAEDDEDEATRGVHDDCPAMEPRLWTSFLVGESAAGRVQAFDAVLAGDRVEAEARLRARHGEELADDLEIAEGFDASLPLAEALVSPALCDMLTLVAADPASPLAEGLSVSVRQRFAA